MTSHRFWLQNPPIALVSQRPGPRPNTTDTNPHTQLTQQAPVTLQDALHERVTELQGVVAGRSNISLTGTRGYHLPPSKEPAGETGPGHIPLDGFMIDREFGHLHPRGDGSAHIVLPPWTVGQVTKNGWAELHPVAALYGMPLNVVMVYGPRDSDELEAIVELVSLSRDYAAGLVILPPSAWVVDSAYIA